jgi:hypothetical protein
VCKKIEFVYTMSFLFEILTVTQMKAKPRMTTSGVFVALVVSGGPHQSYSKLVI